MAPNVHSRFTPVRAKQATEGGVIDFLLKILRMLRGPLNGIRGAHYLQIDAFKNRYDLSLGAKRG